MTEEKNVEQQSIEKLKNEMSKNEKDNYIQTIGEFLITQIKENSKAAGIILSSDKTIKKSLDFMKSEAQKKAVDGFAMFTPEEGFSLVMRYFGIKTQAPAFPEPKTQIKKRKRFDVKLDDFL
ncbi:Cas9 inhibitor AcrIIA9 family protein [Bacillus massiliglaciei]|uniref:Cas9 inhibitor AcrIIA9 family protein n=1 Tax=Bacillus massiliglaciei TaxID=1816693 RepID=UPI000DA5F15B|nr:Cas9 inhibitor AcrIIA9 family protein [Bacillus massiliglaciei]